jgi:hypothetical protein
MGGGGLLQSLLVGLLEMTHAQMDAECAVGRMLVTQVVVSSSQSTSRNANLVMAESDMIVM